MHNIYIETVMERFPKKKGKEGEYIEKGKEQKPSWTRSQMIKTLSQKCRDCGRQKKNKNKKDISSNEEGGNSDDDKEDVY